MKIEQTPDVCPSSVPFSSPAPQPDETPWDVTKVDGKKVDGKKVTVRDLEPQDFPAVLALSDNLDGDELYLRFFTYLPKHLAEWARSETEPVEGKVSLGAFEGENLVAVGHYIANREFGTAEIAVVVAHRNHHRWIATALLRRLGAHAKRVGTQRLVADVQTPNGEVRRVVAAAGWPCRQHRDGDVLTIEVNLTEYRSTRRAESEPAASLSAECAVR